MNTAIVQELDIAAPRPMVWPWLTEPRRILAWADSVAALSYAQGWPPAQPMGARFTQTLRAGPRLVVCEGELTAFIPPECVRMTFGNADITMNVEYRLLERGRRTQLFARVDADPHTRRARVLWLLLGGYARRVLVRQLRALQTGVEGEAAVRGAAQA